MTSASATVPAKTRKAIRAYFLQTNERIRITRNGEVHAYGVMPNTNLTGWYLVGFDAELARDMRETGNIEA